MMKLVPYSGKVDLTGKVVVLSDKHYQGDLESRRFRCESGFGCRPFTSGNAIFGEFLADGQRARVERWQVESVEVEDDDATQEEDSAST